MLSENLDVGMLHSMVYECLGKLTDAALQKKLIALLLLHLLSPIKPVPLQVPAGRRSVKWTTKAPSVITISM